MLRDIDENVKVKMLYTDIEKLAIALGLIAGDGTPIKLTLNREVC